MMSVYSISIFLPIVGFTEKNVNSLLNVTAYKLPTYLNCYFQFYYLFALHYRVQRRNKLSKHPIKLSSNRALTF